MTSVNSFRPSYFQINNQNVFSIVDEHTLQPEEGFFEAKKHFFDTRSKKKFLLIEASFVDSKKFSLM